jgi:capsular exopolysaccharide synthesis family protein
MEEEVALGKFYDAMQRVSGSEEQKTGHTEPSPVTAPDIDEALLKPEGADGDFPAGDSVGEEPMSFETAVLSTSPGMRELDNLKAELGIDGKAEPVLRVVGIIQKLFAYRRTPRESVILVASAVAKEGTSTVARNVALALAQHRAERVLLIDANLRSPSQHRFFGLENPEGLGDVLLGPKVLTSVIRDDVAPGLSLLASGQSMASPAQLLTVASLHSVMMALLSLYDWVIVDSPPVTAYPDVATIAAACGGAILVVEAEKTRREVVEEAKRVLDTSGVDLLGAVLNRRQYHIPDAIYRRL